MNRRAFISKTALTALAAPFLPTALATTPAAVAPAKPWHWRGEWRRGNRIHVEESDNVGDLLDFIGLEEHWNGELKIWQNGKLIYTRRKNRLYD